MSIIYKIHQYANVLIALRYDTYGPNTSSFSYLRWNVSLFTLSEQMIIRELSGCDLSIWKCLKNFYVCLTCKSKQNFAIPRSFIR